MHANRPKIGTSPLVSSSANPSQLSSEVNKTTKIIFVFLFTKVSLFCVLLLLFYLLLFFNYFNVSGRVASFVPIINGAFKNKTSKNKLNHNMLYKCICTSYHFGYMVVLLSSSSSSANRPA